MRMYAADAALAVVIGTVVILGAALGDGATPAGYALTAAAAATLAAHRHAPRTVLLVSTALTAAHVVTAHPGPLAALPVIAAVHTASRAGHRGLGAGFAAGFLAVYATQDALAADGATGRAMLLAGWFLCAVVTGLADKNWQAYLHQTEQRALEAERTREEAALRRAGEERLRIARELHDSLTHSISIVKLQAGVAVHLARKRGEEIPAALLAIQEASGEAMRELRATLDVLRTDEPTGTPALLVERARSAGIPVTLTVTGRERALPPQLDRTVYRLVQEALTNVARHAGGAARTDVRLAYGETEVTVHVTDEGTADPARPAAEGTGLTGMRERVTASGGTLTAGPRAGGGFEIRAALPMDPAGADGPAPESPGGAVPDRTPLAAAP
ncbi:MULTISPECIES: sensor histidine kinase [unclassified Streptomyces]|uniref:sensor histidine kinase n=1 Tax=unclassified Streptomyces TaxID=2593676 RepID=UPI000DB9999A|nr:MULTISPECIES: sensor histidine kinase [unclassified Streptomyces]MYT71636.1 sensor histidine kinase [Streptomyces sp. SID8367]RAJ72886.1 histidine kinase [Streptomyces sp. PsTaAH-137]